jgi:hypothetical protein
VKTFILAFYDESLPERTMIKFLDHRPEVLNWLSLIPNTVFITSNYNVRVLAMIIRQQFPDTFFLISEHNYNKADGGLTDEAWRFLNNPKPA